MGEIGEGDLRAGRRAGGRITGAIAVARSAERAIEYTQLLLLSWHHGYFRIARWRGGERRWREFDRVLRLLRELGWADAVPVFDAGDPKLLRVRAVARALGVPPTPRRTKGIATPDIAGPSAEEAPARHCHVNSEPDVLHLRAVLPVASRYHLGAGFLLPDPEGLGASALVVGRRHQVLAWTEMAVDHAVR